MRGHNRDAAENERVKRKRDRRERFDTGERETVHSSRPPAEHRRKRVLRFRLKSIQIKILIQIKTNERE